MNAKNFGLVMTSLVRPSVRRPYVRPYAIRNAKAPVFVLREVAWRDAFTTEMIKNTNTKPIYMYSLDMLTNVERRERERKRKQKAETIKQSST